jgi:hypothetical protein
MRQEGDVQLLGLLVAEAADYASIPKYSSEEYEDHIRLEQ